MFIHRRGTSCLIYMIMALLLAALSGCASQDEEDHPQGEARAAAVKLEFWTPFSGGDNQFMTEMVNQFNKENPSIEVVQMNTRLDDYYSRLRTAIMSGSAPDLAILHQTSLPQFVQNGYIEKLTEPARQAGLDWKGFNANILESIVYDGNPYAVPLDTHALVMYYNKSYLRQAGLLDGNDMPMMSSGADGFHAFLKQLKASIPPDAAPLAQPSTRIDSVWLWWSLYNQLEGGGAFYNEELTETVFNNPKALKALDYTNQLYKQELIPPNINDSFKLFYDGKAAVLITGMWGTGAFEKAPGLDFGVIPMPVLYDHAAVWGDSHTIAIPTKLGMTDAKKAAALIFAKWCVEHGEMWAEAGHVPSMTKVVASEPFNSLKYRSAYAATANYVAYWPRHVRQWSIVEILIQEFEKMNYSQQTPEQTLENAAKRVNIELKK
ncbi:multiple sugar transport system substrate-binding protein [Paenibacillus endophyticus]|uniref:Multiple sugar transport system substrate-binding protein n=1 Tax=Paenibacillus endophyticus TaxID=1294268 RepID=A0A7W5C4U4_9BACL|nr:ABC transporter substrate-binding protein [Paenibacillus endophyticus]MBB3150780.1 multiple sugar transport system substrate-binding protein [Paenibacillus endophyticus]